MESSSNDSFLWSDASNDSVDCGNNGSLNSMDMNNLDYNRRSKSDDNLKQDECDANLESNIKSEAHQQKTRKRKCSEAMPERTDYLHLEGKRIKLEPESDKDVRKKQKRKERGVLNNSQDSVLYNEDYLNLRIKQEQSSSIQTKKEKHKRSNSNNDHICESDSAVEQSMESYLNMRVKQEQSSIVEPVNVKSKKNKKRKQSPMDSDKDIASEKKSTVKVSKKMVSDDSTAIEEQSKYSIIKEQFSADETVVEKPRKKKRNRDLETKHNSGRDNELHCIKKKSAMGSEINSDTINNNDLSLEATDFTCNNIISSTIINSSAIDVIDNKPKNKPVELLKRNGNIYTTKISDRIRFEDDDNSSQQESIFGETSTKINLFLKANPHLELCSPESPEDCLITGDDEIWTLTLSHEIDLEKLRNTTLISEGKCKIKIDGQTYDGIPNEGVDRITLLTHQCGRAVVTNLPVKISMNYQKRIPKVHIPDNNVIVNNQSNFTLLPETKCRHPLFGAHYKRAIKISTVVRERLQAATGGWSEYPSKTTSKKKHKKNKSKIVDIKMEEDAMCIKPESEPIKKKKKQKHSQDTGVSSKKSKYNKHDPDTTAVWESEKAIEENLFNF